MEKCVKCLKNFEVGKDTIHCLLCSRWFCKEVRCHQDFDDEARVVSFEEAEKIYQQYEKECEEIKKKPYYKPPINGILISGVNMVCCEKLRPLKLGGNNEWINDEMCDRCIIDFHKNEDFS
jgi:hypothetical protein